MFRMTFMRTYIMFLTLGITMAGETNSINNRLMKRELRSWESPMEQNLPRVLFEDSRFDHGTFFNAGGFHGWSQENNMPSLVSDCAKAIRKIPRQHQFSVGNVAFHQSCTIKVGGTGNDIPGDVIEEWALDMILMLARDPHDKLYEPEISGTYYGNFYGKVICMGEDERPCEPLKH